MKAMIWFKRHFDMSTFRIFIGYVPIRIVNYLPSLKPYLWWHALLDGAVVIFVFALAALSKWGQGR
jgi:hypothetical protein